MSSTGQTSTSGHPGELCLLIGLCFIAGVRIFLCAAATPFFTNVDEQAHFDLVCKYARSYLPTPGNDLYDQEAIELIVPHQSPEFMQQRNIQITGRQRASLQKQLEQLYMTYENIEVHSPPAYYLAAGGWYFLGKTLGLSGMHLLIWVRFLNVLIYTALMVVAYFFVRHFYPGQVFLRMAVVLLLSFFPQDVLWSINADILSPLLFLVALFLLLEWHRRDQLFLLLGCATGLAVAAAFLVKYTNLAVLALLGAVLIQKACRLARAGELKTNALTLAFTALAAGGPILAWLLRNYLVLGDLSGTATKVTALGWTYKPFGDLSNHPLFTPAGFLYFWGKLLQSYWNGEIVWHGEPTSPSWIGHIFLWSSTLLLFMATLRWWASRRKKSEAEWSPDGYLLTSMVLSVLVLMILSLSFDFGACWYPSRQKPYFVSGRLIIGTLVPFLILQLRGLEFMFARSASKLGPGIVVAATLVLMLVAKVDFLLEASQSPYNWFHQP